MKLADAQPGSAAYSREFADLLQKQRRDGIALSYTDMNVAEVALRSHANAPLRRSVLACIAVVGFAVLALVGLPDRNGDGRVDFGDLVWSAAPSTFGSK